MITLKNAQVKKETEKAFLISFNGFTKPQTKIFEAQDFDCEEIELWFPKVFVKQTDAILEIKENKNFGFTFELEVGKKLFDLKLKKESCDGVELAGVNFKVSRNGKLTFKNEDGSFFVGISENQPRGYYESHRFCKGESNFGKTFFVDGLPIEEKEILSSLRNWLGSEYSDHGYSHKFMLKTDELKDDGKNKWVSF